MNWITTVGNKALLIFLYRNTISCRIHTLVRPNILFKKCRPADRYSHLSGFYLAQTTTTEEAQSLLILSEDQNIFS